MAINMQNGKIRVYNYEESPCGFVGVSDAKGHTFYGKREDEEFVMKRIPWEDVESANRESDVFKVGRLRFDPDEEKEIYQKLDITDIENIMNDKELNKFLMEDSIENIKRISEIKSSTLILRMKKMLFRMERAMKNPPHNIIAVVTERNNELKGRYKRQENSIINKIIFKDQQDKEDAKLKETIEDLKAQVKELSKPKNDDVDLAEIMAMMKSLKEENEALKKAKEEPVKQEAKKPTTRRPRKTSAKKEDEK